MHRDIGHEPTAEELAERLALAPETKVRDMLEIADETVQPPGRANQFGVA